MSQVYSYKNVTSSNKDKQKKRFYALSFIIGEDEDSSLELTFCFLSWIFIKQLSLNRSKINETLITKIPIFVTSFS